MESLALPRIRAVTKHKHKSLMVLEMNRQQGQRDDIKAAFGRKLKELLSAKSWNQSDLAKATGMGRDSISTYIQIGRAHV